MDELTKIINNPQLNKDIYIDYCILLEEIENFKINIKNKVPNYATKRGSNEAKRINCTLFENLIKNDIDIDTLINNYNQNCPDKWKITDYSKFKIYFPYQIMIDLTKEIIVFKVVNHLKHILKNVPNIQSIIYAGSVSSNDFIISMIKERIPECPNHYRSAFPSIAVAKGAVIFGFDPYIIKSRISKFTIGIRVSEKWNELIHGKRKDLKFFDKEYNYYCCSNVFSPIIYREQKININEVKCNNYNMRSSQAKIRFYKTIYKNVKFIDEKSISLKKKCYQFGELIFDVGDKFDKNSRGIVVELYLGGTFIDAKIKYKEIEKSAIFDFSLEE